MLREYRNKTNLTQADLAKRLGVDTQFVSNIERGVAPIPAKHFRTLNDAIGVPFKQLLSYNLKRYESRLRKGMKK